MYQTWKMYVANIFIAFEIRNIGLSGLWVLDNKIEPFSNSSMKQYKAMKQ